MTARNVSEVWRIHIQKPSMTFKLPSPSSLLKLFNGEPKQRQRRRRLQLEQQKSNRCIVAKHQLCTCIKLFCTFLCRHCTTTTFECLISRFVKEGNTRQQLYFSFPELWYSPLEFSSKKIANIWRIKRDVISAIKFEAARIHFLSEVLVAVAVVVA